MTRIALIAAGALMLIIGGLGLYARHATAKIATLKSDVAQYEASLESATQAIGAVKTELDRRDALLTEVGHERNRMRVKLQRSQRALADAYDSVEGDDCGARIVPAVVTGLLLDAARNSGAANSHAEPADVVDE